MRVSKTRQHGSYRRVTELHLTQFPIYIISSRGETSDQSQPTTTPMFAFTFWLFRRLKTRFANRRPELFIPLGFFEDRFIPLSPSSPAYSFQTSPRKISFRFFIRFFSSIILPRSYHSSSLRFSRSFGIRRCNLIYFEKVELRFFFSPLLLSPRVYCSRQNF